MAGQGVLEVAKEYKIPKQTVSAWAQTLDSGQIGTKKAEDFSALMSTYLQETLTTLAVQQRHFRDPKWLGQQPASDLAVLHGVSADKAVRILEAAERANGQQ
jgi:hypothetical protein